MSQPSKKTKGFLCLVLHAHLPFVRHPECEYMMEENWFYEALTETYLPLLSVFQNLKNDNVPFRITMSITPPLCAMFGDELLKERYSRHINKLIELAGKEVDRTIKHPEFSQPAMMYLERFSFCKMLYEDVYNRDMISAFRQLQDSGHLEIITCGATHGFLPTMQFNPNAVRAQIFTAVNSYTLCMNRSPRGIWLPECGYYPGLEKILHEAGLDFFFIDTHGVLFADPQPRYGVYAPVYCKEAPVAVFGRDMESSRQVWSAEAGYPGNPLYRDFYRDIGFDLDMDYIKPYVDPIGIRIHTGMKYYRITGKGDQKKLPYNRDLAMRTANEHAGNFMFNREKQAEYLSSIMDRNPLIVAPYDAELFGHWWYEGPEWLNYLIRKIAFEQDAIHLMTPSDYLYLYPKNQVCEPSFSSWGEGGYSDVWLREDNDWIYRHLHRIEERMVEYATKYENADGLLRRTLNQMARELLLAQSSDWAFIMKTGTMVQYAVRRTKEHIANFLRLYDDIKFSRIDENFINLLESHNNIFPEMDYHVFR